MGWKTTNQKDEVSWRVFCRKIYQTHNDFVLLLALFVTFRLFVAFMYRPGGYVRDYSDFVYYLGGASAIDYGALPFRDYWSEYPPPFPWLSAGLYQLIRSIPLWEEERLWFNSVLTLFLLIWETVSFIALYGIALRAWDRERALRVAWLYAGLFTPVYTMTSAFDAFPLAFMLLGLWAILAVQPAWAGLAIGAGTAIKLFPAVMLGPAMYALRGWRQWTWLIGTALLVVGILMGAAYAFSPAYFTAFARGLVTRSSWSTIWALWDGFDLIGAVKGDRADPQADVTLHDSHVPWAWVTLVFGLIYAWVWTRRRDDRTPHRMIALAGFTTALFFLYFKAWNPQYLVYLLPFIVLLLPNLRGLTYAILLTALNVVEHPILASMLTEAPWLLATVVLARTVMLAILAVDFAWISTRPSLAPPTWWPRVVQAAVLLTVVASVALWGPVREMYISSRLLKEPYSATIAFLQAGDGATRGTVIITDGLAFRHLYPFLHEQTDLILVAGPRQDTQLESLARREAPFWVWVDANEEAKSVERLAAGRPVTRLKMPNGNLYRIGVNEGWLPAGLGTLGGRFRLINAHVDPPLAMPGQKITLVLYWLRVEPLPSETGETEGSYTVFTHLLTPKGLMVAGRDNPPVDGTMPTDTWPEHTLIEDRYRLRVPWGAQAGDYLLEVGMYDPATGVRLEITDPSGQPSGDRILLPTKLRVLPRLWRRKL